MLILKPITEKIIFFDGEVIMKNKFEQYYHQYLNYSTDKSIVTSIQRTLPLDEHYYYYMIGTYINNKGQNLSY